MGLGFLLHCELMIVINGGPAGNCTVSEAVIRCKSDISVLYVQPKKEFVFRWRICWEML